MKNKTTVKFEWSKCKNAKLLFLENIQVEAIKIFKLATIAMGTEDEEERDGLVSKIIKANSAIEKQYTTRWN